MQALAKVQKQPEHRRAAWHEISFVPAGQIAASVVLQERIAVPQCWSEQQRKARRRQREVSSAQRGQRLPLGDRDINRHGEAWETSPVASWARG